VNKITVIDVLILLLLSIATACGILFYLELRKARVEVSEYTTIQEQFTNVTQKTAENDVSDEPSDEAIDVQIPPAWAGLPLVEVDFEALLLINPDTVGWIAIPDTPISYPVVQTTNNTKYLTTSFNGTYSRAGTPFADRNNNLINLDNNTIIYGHNMGVGRDDMFGTLLEYKEVRYFNRHRYIQFDTIYHQYGWWEVFAVIKYDSSLRGFQFLQIGFTDTESFMRWITRVRELSLHESDSIITPQSNILTLSTCDRSEFGRSGRVLILAVNVSYVALG